MTALALAALLHSCAPKVDPNSMARLVHVESHENEFALHDNATDTEYEPRTRDEALTIFFSLKRDSARRCAIAQLRHRYCLIDVGLAQVDESNFPESQVASMLNPCTNLRTAAPIMLSAWRTAVANAEHSPATWSAYVQTYGAPGLSPEQIVLRAAFSIYNCNSAFGNPSYVARIEAAGSDPFVREVTAAADAVRVAEEVHHDR